MTAIKHSSLPTRKRASGRVSFKLRGIRRFAV